MHRVGITFLVDGEFDRLAAVHSCDRLAVLVAAGDAGDIAQVHRLAVNRRDDRVGHLLNRRKLVKGPHQESLRALFQAAAGEVDVFLAQPPRNRLDRDIQLGELSLVHEDLDLVLVAAADLDRRGAVDGLEIRFQAIIREAAQVLEPIDAAGVAAGAPGIVIGVHECQAHDRLGGWIEAQQDRPAGLDRQLQQVDLLAHVDAREVHVRAPGELQDHVGLASA